MSLTTDNGPQPPPGVLRAWFALHRCPACGSTNVRRSTIRSRESGAHALRSPYRCRACSERFWVLSRKARTLTIAGIVAGFAAALVVAFAIVADDDSTGAPIAPASEEVEVLRPTPPRDAAPKAASARSPTGTPAAAPSAAAPPAPVPAAKAPDADGFPPLPAGVEKPLRPPAQPFVK